MTHYLPHANKPSIATLILEFLSVLIILDAGALWLAGTFGIFLMVYLLGLGVLGLFAWPRRHALLFTLLAFLGIAALVVNIILRAIGLASCIPFMGENDSTATGATRDVYCGKGIATYVTHGIMIVLLLLAIPFALKIAAEKREKKLHSVVRSDKFVMEKDRVAPFATGATFPGTTYPGTTGYSTGGPMMGGVSSTTAGTTGIPPSGYPTGGPMMMGGNRF